MLTILVSISIALSLIAIFQFKNLSDFIDKQVKNINLLNKVVNENKESYIKLLEQLKTLENELSSLKSKTLRNNDDLKEKIVKLYERWEILADDRITSIPKGHKEWWDAKEIVNQPTLKTWKTQGLSQTKSSMINTQTSYSEEDEEINQDFTSLDDNLLDEILDDEDEADSSSSFSSTQIQKPKQKKKTTQRKM